MFIGNVGILFFFRRSSRSLDSHFIYFLPSSCASPLGVRLRAISGSDDECGFWLLSFRDTGFIFSCLIFSPSSIDQQTCLVSGLPPSLAHLHTHSLVFSSGYVLTKCLINVRVNDIFFAAFNSAVVPSHFESNCVPATQRSCRRSADVNAPADGKFDRS